jgi:hypothetical protein
VVEEPAKRYSVEVHPQLVDALIEDAPKEDALPLLAFALQRLWRQYAASGALTQDNYDKVGGLTGLIEDAAERALRGLEPEQDVPLPAGDPPKRVIELGRSTFVPTLVQINDKGQPIRRVPQWEALTDEQHELLDRFDRWRLVVKKGTESGAGTVEVAHEALFREWNRLKEWLEPERARLEALRVLQVDAAAWKRQGRERAFLNHREERLAEADALATHPEFGKQVGNDEREYLVACRSAERTVRKRARRTQALVAVLVLLLIGAGVGLWKQGWLRDQVARYFRVQTAYEAIRDYGKYVSSKPAMRPCLSFIQTLDEEELSDILFYTRTEHFEYDRQRHWMLQACLPDNYFTDPRPLNYYPLDPDQSWTLGATRSVRSSVLRDLHAFDDALLTFRYDVGDRRILCENLIGYVRVWNEFYRKLIEIKYIDDENFPSIKYFVEMVGSNGCASLEPK